MPRTIIVGFDDSDHGLDALELGRTLARLARAKLVIACAYPDDPLGESATAAEIGRGLHADAEQTLSRARERLTEGGEAEFRAVAGATPSDVLHALAEELDAAAIVVGATHHGAALRLLTGSTPAHVLDHAPCAVAVAPDGYAARAGADTEAPLRVAVAFDDSAEAARALDVAASFVRGADARLRIVTAVDVAAVGMYPPLDVTTYEQLATLARESARSRLDAAVARLGGDASAEVEVLEGDPVGALVEDSATEDLLFAGSRAHGPFRRVLTGSVSRHLLREAACPVVIVPRGSGEGA